MKEQSNFGKAVWKLFMFKGILLLITGLILILFPQATLTVLVFIMGVYWLIDGVTTIVKSFNERSYAKHWGWGVFTGVLGTIAGLVVLSKPMFSSILTTSFLMWFIGISALVYGGSGLITAFQMQGKSAGKTTVIFGSIFSILIGLVLVSSPYISALVIVYIIGLIAIIGGITILITASNIKKKLHQKN